MLFVLFVVVSAVDYVIPSFFFCELRCQFITDEASCQLLSNCAFQTVVFQLLELVKHNVVSLGLQGFPMQWFERLGGCR